MATDADRQVGENVAQLRGDMSQKALATAMRDQGHKWSQSTVWAVERGERPLKLVEAASLVSILGNVTTVDHLLAPSSVRSSLQRLRAGMDHTNALKADLFELLGRIDAALQEVNAARMELAVSNWDEVLEGTTRDSAERRLTGAESIAQRGVRGVVEEAFNAHERQAEGAGEESGGLDQDA